MFAWVQFDSEPLDKKRHIVAEFHVEDRALNTARLLDIYRRLLRHYGPQRWWPAETRFEMIVGAILTQSVAWTNVEKAIANLKAAGALEPAVLHSLSMDHLAQLVRPSGYYNVKARKVKAFVEHLGGYGYDLDALFSQETPALRDELLSIHGVGPETADSIILYAAHQPVFVIDAYTMRLFPRLGLVPEGITYDQIQAFFHENLPRDVALYQEYHALIVQQCKYTCAKKPACTNCPLDAVCQFN